MKTLEKLQNTTIISIDAILDYWQITTEVAVISIYTSVECARHSTLGATFELTDLSETIGRTITAVKYSPDDAFVLETDNSLLMRVPLSESACVTPEAVCIHYMTGEIVVM